MQNEAIKTSDYILILTLIVFVLITGALFLPSRSDDETEVSALVGTGHRFLALRLPAASAGTQEDIVVYDDDSSLSVPRLALRGPAGRALLRGEGLARVQLAPEDWQRLQRLRIDWCLGAPTFAAAADETLYDLALSCELSSKRLSIPASELPPALQRLIEIVPSPAEVPE